MNRFALPLLTAVALLATGCQNASIPSAAVGTSQLTARAAAAANPYRIKAQSLKLNTVGKTSISAQTQDGRSINLVDPMFTYGAIAWVDGKAVSTTSKTEAQQIVAAFDGTLKQQWRAYHANPASVKDAKALTALVNAFTTLQWSVADSLK